MRRVGLLVLGAVTTVAAFVGLVPPHRSAAETSPWWISADPEIATLQRSVRARQDSVRALQAAEERRTAIEIARRLAPPRTGYAVTADPGVPRATREQLEPLVREEFASLRDAPQVPLRVHLATSDAVRSGYRKVAVLPETATGPCTVVVLVSAEAGRLARFDRRDRYVGPCGFLAEFGPPSGAVRAELDAVRWVIALTDVDLSTPPSRRERFDARTLRFAPQHAACLAGRDASCELIWEPTQAAAPLPPEIAASVRGTARSLMFSARGSPGNHLAALRASLGDARFAELWTGTAGIRDGYARLDGRSIGAFVRAQLLREVEPYRPGPLHGGLPLVLGLSVGAACVLATLRFTRRERS